MSPPLISSFIGGKRVAHEGPRFPLVRPQDGRTIGEIAESGEAGVAAAVAAASATFAKHRRAPTHKRIEWLKRAAGAMASATEELAQLISEDVGKPIRIARGEVKRGVEFVEACAAALAQIGGEVLPLDSVAGGAGRVGFTRRMPYGVVAGITPFNAPINLLVQKVAPAIAAGNAIVVKPAPAGTRTALRLAELLVAAGWPLDLFNVVTGDRETASTLVRDPEVRAVSFTGSTAGGEALARAAGAKKFVAELGSNAANIVMADADLDDAAKKIAGAAFEASGQQCISAQRVLVAQSAFESFLDKFVAAASALKAGRADDETSDLGPMVSTAAAERVIAMCQEAVVRGARYALRPRREGALVTPGILVGVPRSARLWREEAFGPVAIVMPFETVDEALALANDSPFGLQGALFTRDLATAFRFAEEFEVGSLWVNEASRFRLDMYPFGGVKQSGIGREGVRYAIEELSQLKFVGIRV
ncbi:MAG: aldehyde dehydrogenase family protein [Rhodospirillales bacterium]|nr:aldehyde dehydrogenase family protein [Rhodospirillales bacterium]